MLCWISIVGCPFCNSNLNKVIDKRAVNSSGEIRRRRECLKCGKRFTTYEILADLKILVVKKDGRREVYNEEKLKAGILKALEKRPGINRVQIIIDKIESKIRTRGLKEIPSGLLGGWVLNELKKIDGVAYLRFASVYRDFDNLRDFEKEIKSL